MQYASFGLNDANVIIPADTWKDVPFNAEWADPGDDHIDEGSNPSILKGDDGAAIYTGEFAVTVAGTGLVGKLLQMRTAEFKYNATATPPVDELVEWGDPETGVLSEDLTAHLAAVGSVQEGRKLRVQVRHSEDVEVKITRARARLLVQL